MNEYSSELKKVYTKFIGAFSDYFKLPIPGLNQHVDEYSRSCALCLWATFDADYRNCYEAISALNSDGKDANIYSAEEVKKTFAEIKGKHIIPKIPEFYLEIVHYDKLHHTNYSRVFASGFQVLLLSFCMIDSKVSFDEATEISKYHKVLIDTADQNEIIPFDADSKFDPFRYVNQNNQHNDAAAKKTPLSDETDHVNTQITGTDNAKDLTKAMKELNELIGLANVKNEVQNIVNFVRIQQMRRQRNLPSAPMSYHLVFTGNPGTGKTTVARMIGRIYKDLGILSKGQLVEVDKSDLVAGYVGQTAERTHNVIQRALGGVLFIDEAYSLVGQGQQDFGQESIDTLIKEMEDHRDDFVVIVAGYDDLMQEFIGSNPGLKSRFNHYIHFEDYSGSELYKIFQLLCKKDKYNISDDAEALLIQYFDELAKKHIKNFGNGREVRNIYEKVITAQANRISKENGINDNELVLIKPEDLSDIHKKGEETLADQLDKLNSLIGLNSVKKEIADLVDLVQVQNRRKANNLPVPAMSYHLVFTGNPGTGKTTVARQIAKIYKSLGIVSEGQCVETDRSGLVAGYVGQTAIKTQNVIEKAIGGILFIDEAYTLSEGNEEDFGQEAITTILKAMEDHRDNLVIIVAGYNDLMQKFIKSNPGLESRFNRYINFEDYSGDELYEIFMLLCKQNSYTLSQETSAIVRKAFMNVDAKKIGNGRGVRNIFEDAIKRQAARLAKSGLSDNTGLSELKINDILPRYSANEKG